MANDVLIDMLASLSLDSGVVTSSAEPRTIILSDNTKNWPTDKLKHCIVRIVSGKGVGQLARIEGNSADSLQVSPPWIEGLSTSSSYVIYQPEVTEYPGRILGEINTLLTRLSLARSGYLDELAPGNIPSDIDGLKTSRDRQVLSLDFWSLPQEEVSVPAVAEDLTLPDVVVNGIPAGATIVRAIAMSKFRIVENTNGTPNALSGNQVMQIRDDSPGAWVDAISFADNMFGLAASTREGGDVIIGAINVSGAVDGNDTYNFQWHDAVADLASINFNDVQVGLRIYFGV